MAPGLAQHLLQQYALRGLAERLSRKAGRSKLSATWLELLPEHRAAVCYLIESSQWHGGDG